MPVLGLLDSPRQCLICVDPGESPRQCLIPVSGGAESPRQALIRQVAAEFLAVFIEPSEASMRVAPNGFRSPAESPRQVLIRQMQDSPRQALIDVTP